MKKIQIITSFMRFTQARLLQKAQMILQSMTGNAYFPTPTPDLATVGNAISAYAEALASQKSVANTAIKKQARVTLIAILNQLALYVSMNGNNDETILLSSGFSLRKQRTPVGVLPKPANFKAEPAYNGAVRLSNDKISGADGYTYSYTPAPVTEASIWTIINSTKAKLVISNLTSGTQYAFRVAGIGANPTIVYSDVVTSYVL